MDMTDLNHRVQSKYRNITFFQNIFQILNYHFNLSQKRHVFFFTFHKCHHLFKFSVYFHHLLHAWMSISTNKEKRKSTSLRNRLSNVSHPSSTTATATSTSTPTKQNFSPSHCSWPFYTEGSFEYPSDGFKFWKFDFFFACNEKKGAFLPDHFFNLYKFC